MLIVGKQGTGKTNMLGTAADNENLYILALEGGLATINDKKFEYDDCLTWAEFEKNCGWLFKNYKAKGYTAVGLDSFDKLQRHLIDHISKDGKLTRDQFFEIRGKLRKVLSTFINHPDLVFLCTCHISDEKDGDNGSVKELLSLDGAIKYEVANEFDNVCVTRVGKDSKGAPAYWLEITGDERTVAKTRLRHLRGKSVVPADYASFIAPSE